MNMNVLNGQINVMKAIKYVLWKLATRITHTLFYSG
uniref:Uncharacterized protein n=1 Tax=Rhizophora mucronata TaxID=61149 RepID=A0A2P2IK44_RHIMU